MTPDENVTLEHRLTVVEDRSNSNTKRLNEHDLKIKENRELIDAIKDLALETKYMREELNDAVERLNKLESKDGDKWEKFKWLIVAGVVSIILGYLAGSIGLQ